MMVGSGIDCGIFLCMVEMPIVNLLLVIGLCIYVQVPAVRDLNRPFAESHSMLYVSI